MANFHIEFIDELVEKHGYDRDILMNTWNTIVVHHQEEIEKADVKKSQPDKEATKKVKKTCPYMYESGKKKNQMCGTWVKHSNEIFCAKHTENKLAKVQKEKLFGHLVKAFENLSTSHGGTFAELIYDPDTGYPIIKYKFPTKAANFLKTIPKEVFEEFAQEQLTAPKDKKIERK